MSKSKTINKNKTSEKQLYKTNGSVNFRKSVKNLIYILLLTLIKNKIKMFEKSQAVTVEAHNKNTETRE